VGKGVVDIDKSPTENLKALAQAKGARVEDLTVIILYRPRHEALIKEVRQAGARIRLISDGDVSAAIATTKPETGIDLLLGIGGAPEGVLAAAALRCVGGEMQGRLKPRNPEEIERAHKMGIKDIEKKFSIEDLASGEVMFAATGVTDGDYLDGVHFFPGGATTHSVVMRSKTRTIRFVNAIHHFAFKPKY
jgi:fructose-1,6-bisphosphatase II